MNNEGREDKGVLRLEDSDTFGFTWLDAASSRGSLLSRLLNDHNFQNPNAIELMCRSFEITEDASFASQFDGPGAVTDYLILRESQNLSWSERKTKEGILRAGEGQHAEALLLYKQALHLAPTNFSARIARGCSLANMGNFADAIRDFRLALQQDPANENAAAYLAHTIEKRDNEATALQQKQQKQRPYLLVVEDDDVQNMNEFDVVAEPSDDEEIEKGKKSKKRKRHHRKGK